MDIFDDSIFCQLKLPGVEAENKCLSLSDFNKINGIYYLTPDWSRQYDMEGWEVSPTGFGYEILLRFINTDYISLPLGNVSN